MKHQCLLLGLLLPNQIHHMVNGINCCVWLTYDTQKTSQLAWSGMIVCCQSYRGYFEHILCLIPLSALSSVTAQQRQMIEFCKTEILESQTETQFEVSLRFLHQYSTFLDQNLAHSLCMKSLLGIWSCDQKHMEAPESSSYPSNFLEANLLLTNFIMSK